MQTISVIKFISLPIKYPGYSENGWFTYSKVNPIAIYVRKGPLYLNNIHFHLVFQIARVNVTNRGEGGFTKLLEHIEKYLKHYNYDALYIENIMDRRFWDFFVKQGFETIYGFSGRLPHCCFKIYNEEYLKDQISKQFASWDQHND